MTEVLVGLKVLLSCNYTLPLYSDNNIKHTYLKQNYSSESFILKVSELFLVYGPSRLECIATPLIRVMCLTPCSFSRLASDMPMRRAFFFHECLYVHIVQS